MNPVTSHAPIKSAGEFTSRAMSAETMKMPDPIIEPITSIVALVRPRPFTSSLSWWEWMSQSLAAGAGVGGFVWILTSLRSAQASAHGELHLGSAMTLPQDAEKFFCRFPRLPYQTGYHSDRICPRFDDRPRI